MKTKIAMLGLLILVCLPLTTLADKRFQAGVKFGIVRAPFETIPDGANNPFDAVNIDSRIGFIGGVYYDYQILRRYPGVFFTFGASYKLINFKGNYLYEGETPVLGNFKNYFHTIDIPVGMKMEYNHLNGRPFFGAGLEVEIIAAESHTQGFGDNPHPDTVPTFNTITPYKQRTNLGPYFCAGFEIPGQTYAYTIEFRYVRWAQDNWTGDSSFYNRGKGEIQVTLGIKIR